MPNALAQITAKELKKMLAESILSDELKTAYGDVLDKMNDEEKSELIVIIEEGNKAKISYDGQRLEKLARLNVALEKHLQNITHKEERYIREEFETFDNKKNEAEMNNIEQEINNL